MALIINPGSGPVDGASRENAEKNMAAFLADAGIPVPLAGRGGNDLGDGRFRFQVEHHGCTDEIDMPGLPLERVRFMDEPDQNIWNFPRLYVNGSSWVWCYALSVLGPHDEADA